MHGQHADGLHRQGRRQQQHSRQALEERRKKPRTHKRENANEHKGHDGDDASGQLCLSRLDPQRSLELDLPLYRLASGIEHRGQATAARMLHIERHGNECELRSVRSAAKYRQRLTSGRPCLQQAGRCEKQVAQRPLHFRARLAKRLHEGQTCPKADANRTQGVGNLVAQRAHPSLRIAFGPAGESHQGASGDSDAEHRRSRRQPSDTDQDERRRDRRRQEGHAGNVDTPRAQRQALAVHHAPNKRTA